VVRIVPVVKQRMIAPFELFPPPATGQRRGRGRRLALVAALLLGTASAPVLELAAGLVTAARADGLTVQPGDVLRVTVTQAPDISREEAKVDADGRIMLPVLGGVPVAGSDLDAIRGAIADRLVAADLIRQPTVVVEIASYRPFYVGGTVAQPGAVPFEPGLTVRHALILAGGLDGEGGKDKTSVEDLVELKTKWRTTNYQMLQIQSRIARLEAELDHGNRPDYDALDTRRVAPGDREEIVSNEGGLFDDRARGWDADERHREQAVALVELEIDVLTQQANLQAQEQALQKDQVERARQLVDKGVMPLPRLQELEREASRISRDLLDNQAYTARARQTKQNRQYELDAADTNWRVDIRAQLSQALLQQAELRAQSEVLATALLAAGIVISGDAEDEPLLPDVSIVRAGETVKAGLDTPILPGDVLEVSIAKAPTG